MTPKFYRSFHITASMIKSGIIDPARIPQAVFERLTVVEDEAGMLALTIDDVQNGDTVKTDDTDIMYFVKDQTKLGTLAAFELYKAGKAAAVDWGTVTGDIDDQDDLKGQLDSKVTVVAGKGLSTNDYTTAEKNKLTGIAENANNYTHPATHPPSIITQDLNNRFVTDIEKGRWNIRGVNQLIVGAAGNFATLKEAVDWFNTSAIGHTEILLDADVEVLSDTITVNNSTYALIIRGYGSNGTFLDVTDHAMDGKPFFDLKSFCDIHKLTAQTTLAGYGTNVGEDFIKCTVPDLYFEVVDIIIDGFYSAVNDTTGSDLFLFNAIASNCVKGIVRNHSNANPILLDIEVVTFDACMTAIDLVKAGNESFIISQVVFDGVTGSTAIKYDGTNYIYGGISNIFSCTWNHVGTFLSGFDFTRGDGRDANIEVTACIGTEDRSPHGKINLINGSSGTTIVTAGTFYKAVFTNTNTYTCKLLMTDNRITYQSDHARDAKMFVTGSLSGDLPNKIVTIGIRKNNTGDIVSPMTIKCATSGEPYSFGILAYLTEVVKDDYFELFVTCDTSGRDVTVQNLNIYFESR